MYLVGRTPLNSPILDNLFFSSVCISTDHFCLPFPSFFLNLYILTSWACFNRPEDLNFTTWATHCQAKGHICPYTHYTVWHRSFLWSLHCSPPSPLPGLVSFLRLVMIKGLQSMNVVSWGFMLLFLEQCMCKCIFAHLKSIWWIRACKWLFSLIYL